MRQEGRISLSDTIPIFESASDIKVVILDESLSDTSVMVDSRPPNTSVITTKADQLITVTTQAGLTTQDRTLGLGITSITGWPPLIATRLH